MTSERTKSMKTGLKIPLCPSTTSGVAEATQKGLVGPLPETHLTKAAPNAVALPGSDIARIAA